MIFQTWVKYLDFSDAHQSAQRAASIFWVDLYLQLTFSLPWQSCESSFAQNRTVFGGAARAPASLCPSVISAWNHSDRGESPPPHWGSRQEGGTFPSESFAKISLLCCAYLSNPPRWEPGTSDGMELWRERFQGYWWRRVVRDGKQVILIHPPHPPPTSSKVTFKTIKTCPKYKSLLLQNIT